MTTDTDKTYHAELRDWYTANYEGRLYLHGLVYNDTLKTGDRPFKDGKAVATTEVVSIANGIAETKRGSRYLLVSPAIPQPRLPYAIGSDHLPGLSKLIEELGEAQQVAGKIVGLGHMGRHWDGSNLKERLEDELGDVLGAINFFGDHNGLSMEHVLARAAQKVELFESWHEPAKAAA